ncbi:MAG TPA: hypothetical protein VGX00_01595 [Thermoplasmata archaeon]|nr:hypothetical protein [Thermoplasmata archaeon]
MAELRGVGAGARMSTSEIAKRLAKVRGKKYHRNSIYNALRLLVRRGELSMVKSGREKIYRLGQAVQRGRPAAPRAVDPASPSLPPAAMAGSQTHKLADGEILVLGASDRHLVAATNRKGRLVLKRHRLPR